MHILGLEMVSVPVVLVAHLACAASVSLWHRHNTASCSVLTLTCSPVCAWLGSAVCQGPALCLSGLEQPRGTREKLKPQISAVQGADPGVCILPAALDACHTVWALSPMVVPGALGWLGWVLGCWLGGKCACWEWWRNPACARL